MTVRPVAIPLVGLALAAGLLAGTPVAAYAERAPAERPAVLESRVIGHTARGRPINAFHLGERGVGPKVLLVSTMHGNEGHTRQILATLRDGRPVHGLNLWVVPVYNPDGLARGTRKNARGVDLNRNYPYRWADLDGDYESGPRPGSERETRAMMGFLRDIKPRWIISFHQPLYGVDTDTKSPRFSRRVARHLDLPRKSFTCGGVCHGTMTGWFNHHFRGTAITVEYGSRPPRRLMRKVVPRQVLSIWDARRR
ncbi:MAG: M14 family zinc carboxypeptidase [Nocardioides sp.]